MDKFLNVRKYSSIVLALLACQILLSAAGRPMHTVENLDRQLTSKSDVETEGNPSPQSPISIHSTSSRRPPVIPPVIPKYSNNRLYTGDLATHDTNDFRPTTPGNSPGIGHRFVGYVQKKEEEQHVKSKAATNNVDVKHVKFAAVQKDFKPTTPGHSPGIGHVLGNKN